MARAVFAREALERRASPLRTQARFAALAAAGLMLISCKSERVRGRLVEGEEKQNYIFEVKAGDVLVERKGADIRLGYAGDTRISVGSLGSAGVVIHTSWDFDIKPRGMNNPKGGLDLMVPYGTCEGIPIVQHLVRFDRRADGKVFLTMLEKHDLDDMKVFERLSDPCSR